MSLVTVLPLAGRRPRIPGGALIGAAALALLVLTTGLAGLIAPHDPRIGTGNLVESPSARHVFGTNELGQDLLSMWLYGGRASLAVGFLAAGLSTIVSGAVGLFSVTWRAGRVPLLALSDGLLAIPNLPLIVLVMVFLGPSIGHLVVALALIGWPAYARVVRAQALVAFQRDYVVAARALGSSDARVLRTCLLPEILPIIWTKFLLTVRWAILMEAALALMGLGDPRQVSWGTMLHGAFTYPLLFLGDAWLWWAAPPALAIAFITIALSAIGQDFDAWLNPASRAAQLRRSKTLRG